MRTAHALSPAARACAHSSGAWQPTRRSASLRHGPGRRNSLRQAPGLPRELPRDCPPRSPRTRINAPASDRLSRSALTTRTTARALRQRSSRDCSVQKGSFLSARAPAPAPPLKRPPPAATLRCSDRRGAPTRAATPRLLQWTTDESQGVLGRTFRGSDGSGTGSVGAWNVFCEPGFGPGVVVCAVFAGICAARGSRRGCREWVCGVRLLIRRG